MRASLAGQRDGGERPTRRGGGGLAVSRGIDTGAKLAAYFSLPSMWHYLIVDIDKRVVIRHRREGESDIRVRILGSGQLSLEPPGLSIAVPDLFHGI
jgi:hypothetical protein